MRPPGPMSNPPPIVFTVPFAPQAFRVVVGANGVQTDGTNVPVPDTTTPIQIVVSTGTAAFSAAIDPNDNRRIIVTPGLLAPAPATTPPTSWSFRLQVTGKPAQVTVTGTTQSPLEMSGVTWDGVPVGPANP